MASDTSYATNASHGKFQQFVVNIAVENPKPPSPATFYLRGSTCSHATIILSLTTGQQYTNQSSLQRINRGAYHRHRLFCQCHHRKCTSNKIHFFVLVPFPPTLYFNQNNTTICPATILIYLQSHAHTVSQ